MGRDSGGRTEGSLLFLALVIVTAGLVLVFLGKTRFGVPQNCVNLNTATIDELAVTLQIPPELAAVLVEHRERLGSFTSVHQPSHLSLFPAPEEAARIRDSLRRSRINVNSARVLDLERELKLPFLIARRIVGYREGPPARRFRNATDILRVPIVDESVISSLGDRLIVRQGAVALNQLVFHGSSFLVLLLAVPILLRRSLIRGDALLLPITLLLSGLGVVTLFSLHDPFRDAPDYIHHIHGLWLGLLAVTIGALMPARHSHRTWLPVRNSLRRYTYVWALAAIILTLLLWKMGGGPENVRLSLGFFQPVEIIKILLVLFVAGYLADRGGILADSSRRWSPRVPEVLRGRVPGFHTPRREDIGPILVMYGAALMMFLVVRDMGPALLLFGVFIVMVYAATGRPAVIGAGAALAVCGFMGAYVLKIGVLPVRIDMWLSPWANGHPNGMQLGQALWGMSSGGIVGAGAGLGAPSTMPRSRDDLIFASLGEETGLIGAFVILTLYATITARGFRIAMRAQTDFDRNLATGLTALLAGQTILIVAGVTGVMPLTGITLPFVAYGNTSLVSDLFIIGVLYGISATARMNDLGSETPPVFRRSLPALATSATVCLLCLIGGIRLIWLQGLAADDVAGRSIRTPDADGVARAKVNPRLLALERAIRRGSIYDRNGRPLATSRPDEIAAFLNGDRTLADSYARKGRYYPRGPLFAHLVGYMDAAVGGPVGLEREYNGVLRGFDSYRDLVADFRMKDLPWWHPRYGGDVVLTADSDIQQLVARSLRAAASALRDRRTGQPKERAAMVVLDPSNGGVLASVSLPAFDPNRLTPREFARLTANLDTSSRLFDRARFGYYPPGSSLKVATAAAGLEEGLEPEYDCLHVAAEVRWRFHGKFYRLPKLADDKGDRPHGRLGMARALAVSCNLYFANLGLRLGPERLQDALANRFLLSGTKPLDQFAANLATNAFGQGTMTATPLEMARIAGAIANRGTMMKPVYVKEVRAQETAGTNSHMGAVLGHPVGEANAARIARMMRGVVDSGTARGVFDDLPVEVAGKTGTAQTLQGDREPHSWFIGFTPFSRPAYAFACVIENGGYGKRGAAPAVHTVLKSLFPSR